MNYVLELFRECNKDEVFQQYSAHVNVGFQEHGDTLLILFEPSDGRVDWRHNFAFFRKPYEEMEAPYYVHGGFLKCWKVVKDDVRARLHAKKWKHVVIAGYSHGGALALLAHECAWFELPELRDGRIITVAFEAPRIYGGWRVKEELKERWAGAWVIRNNRDIVTHMPPRALGFSDVGELAQIKNWNAKINCIKSHAPKWVQKAILARINKNTLAPIEEKLKTTDLWK
jgi:hypothetical protein